MAISLGALVVIGILLVLVCVALLCVGTGGTFIETVSKRFGLKSDQRENANQRGVDSTDKGRIAPGEQKMTVEGEVVSGRVSDKDNSGIRRGKEEDDREDYDYPKSFRSDKSAADNRTDKDNDAVVTSGTLNGNIDPSAHDDSHVYQNARIGKITPKPAPRKILTHNKEREESSDIDSVYQNVSVGKS